MQGAIGRRPDGEITIDGMSRQELRTRLFETLRTRGVADKLKSQLRAKIVAELKLRVHGRGGVAEGFLCEGSRGDAATPNTSRGRLLYQVLDSLVVGYLRSRGLDFTLSVFLPESGCADGVRILAEEDVMQALHLDHRTPFYRALKELMTEVQHEALLINLVTSLTRVADLGVIEAGCQTDMELEDVIEHRVRETDRHLGERAHEQGRIHALALEERMLRYQRDVETRVQREMEQRFTDFRSVELAQMRVEERRRHTHELELLKAEHAAKSHELQELALRAGETERMRLAEREKAMDTHNLELRQRLLEENNRAVMREATLRAEAELISQQTRLERDAVQRQYEEAAGQLTQLRNLKEKYSEKLQEAMAMYKIDINKEYQALISQVEIEKAKVETERAQLQNRMAVADDARVKLRSASEEIERLKRALADANARTAEVGEQKAEAERQVKDLKDKVVATKSSAALEYEISHLTQQLAEAEKMSQKRQDEYQALLKTFMVPDTQKELAKARRAEAGWQRECQQLVLKLDVEINRNEALRRKCDEKSLLAKQYKREVADLKLVLHQTREALGSQMTHSAAIGATDYMDLLDLRARTHHSRASPAPLTNVLPDPYRGTTPVRYETPAYSRAAASGRLPDVAAAMSNTPRPRDDEGMRAMDQVHLPPGFQLYETGDEEKQIAEVLGGNENSREQLVKETSIPAPAAVSRREERTHHEPNRDPHRESPDFSTAQTARVTSALAQRDKLENEHPAPSAVPSPTRVAERKTPSPISATQGPPPRRSPERPSSPSAPSVPTEVPPAAKTAANVEAERAQRHRQAERDRQAAEAEQEEAERERKAEAARQKRLARQAELDELERREREQREKEQAARARQLAEEEVEEISLSAPAVADDGAKETVKPAAADAAIEAVEQDPEMQKYIDIVKARKAAATAASADASREETRDPAAADISISGQVRELMRKVDTSSFMSSRSGDAMNSDEIDFGAGETADEVSAPAFDSTTEDSAGW
ncbi:oxidative DNA demethylase [Geranomyces variabilis]|uniref:Oxidative DNA demethylase n=1 Tax=Geranomyces variabilis TaxID=109894 RepID=A0AAD5XUP9_9FUNG|nr:oxidative DNA demethylase [Geranomyces variabilis]